MLISGGSKRLLKVSLNVKMRNKNAKDRASATPGYDGYKITLMTMLKSKLNNFDYGKTPKQFGNGRQHRQPGPGDRKSSAPQI